MYGQRRWAVSTPPPIMLVSTTICKIVTELCVVVPPRSYVVRYLRRVRQQNTVISRLLLSTLVVISLVCVGIHTPGNYPNQPNIINSVGFFNDRQYYNTTVFNYFVQLSSLWKFSPQTTAACWLNWKRKILSYTGTWTRISSFTCWCSNHWVIQDKYRSMTEFSSYS